MPEQKRRYYVGPNLLSDIRDTITRVNSTPLKDTAAKRVASVSQDPTDATSIRKCTLNGRWPKDTTATLTWTYGGTLTATMTAQNLFRTVPCGTVTVGRVANDWYLLEGQEDPPFRIATFTGDSSGGWAKGTTTTINFSEPLCDGLTSVTAVNHFCSVGGGDVGVSRDEDSKWYLVTWEMDQVCDTKIEDITLALNTATCAILKTIHTATVQYMQMTYPYVTCTGQD